MLHDAVDLAQLLRTYIGGRATCLDEETAELLDVEPLPCSGVTDPRDIGDQPHRVDPRGPPDE